MLNYGDNSIFLLCSGRTFWWVAAWVLSIISFFHNYNSEATQPQLDSSQWNQVPNK